MSELTQEKMAQAFKDQQEQWRAFASKALEGSMKLFELNLKMARQSMADATQSARHLMKAKTPEEVFALDQEVLQERMHHIMAYASEINEIATAYSTELGHAAQSQMKNTRDKVGKLVGDVAQPAAAQKFFPQPGEFNQGFDQWLSAGKKMAEAFGQGAMAQNVFTMPGAAPVKKAAAKPATKPATKTASRAAAKPAARTRARAR